MHRHCPYAGSPRPLKIASPPSVGITLLEMLIAIVISLIVLFAVIKVFDQLNTAMISSRSTIELAGELRNVSQRLQADLDGLTCSTLPWTPADAGDGYFEYIEGTGKDSDGFANYWGDRDDILMFTARSNGKPFWGTNGGTLIESKLAEIIWVIKAPAATTPAGTTIHRIVRLIRPDLTPAGANHTISVSPKTSKANTLADLTLRENRSYHANSFPYEVAPDSLRAVASTQNLVLNRAAAFDVRVYDPMAPIRNGTSFALAPGDPGWAGAGTLIGRGAYVDLNYASDRTISFYSGPANAVSRAATPHKLTHNAYSTWPEAYEQDGEDQDADNKKDEARDGFDTGGLSTSVDDIGETETFPPYPHPLANEKFPGLRGVQVRIRLVESASRQVRQATIVSDFLPE